MSTNPSSHPIIIFDTTLRDGEQSPGASMNIQEKIKVAQMLENLGVNVIEAGFPVVSDGDFAAVESIAHSVRNVSVCALARCRSNDILKAWDALKLAAAPRIHVFLATSAIHRQYKLKMTTDQILDLLYEHVRAAVALCPDVEFSPEDASRTELPFLREVVEVAINAGAKTINIPDTVGYSVPAQMGNIISNLIQFVPNIHNAVLSVHCHNDLGMAVANSLAAVAAGAGQVECTMNGIGERAGNCALEELVMALKTRCDYYNAHSSIIPAMLLPASKLVASVTGLDVPRNKAIVGRNAFAHEAGIHQDGVLKNPATYEIIRPEDVGFAKNDLVLGKHSGRAALAERVALLGYNLDQNFINDLFLAFKSLADRKKEVYDDDIRSLVQRLMLQSNLDQLWRLESYSCCSSSDSKPNVCIKLRCGQRYEEIHSHDGDGPIDALFLALGRLTGRSITCREYNVHSVTMGHDAQGDVTVRVVHDGIEYRGSGVSTDCIEASILAFLDAINRILHEHR